VGWEGKVAVVTGAGSGIGLAMARAFAGVGVKVVAADIAPARLTPLEKVPGLSTVRADVGKAADVSRMIEFALQAHGQLDILCNNAGVPDLFQGAGDCTDEQWDRSLAVNLTAAFLASRAAIPAMLKVGAGVIINTGSVASFRGGEAGVAYTVAKHGLIGLTRSIAAMYGRERIRCVAICPGPVTTGITKLNAERRAEGLLDRRGEETAKLTAGLRWRWAEPEEIAELALFLASDHASALNGCAIPADSGRMAY
jgi:NAD(P)-dependent dehydrogenase (short-subunit alcohol dehydrogenase family)